MKCTDCYSPISDTFVSCPNCGSEVKRVETIEKGVSGYAMNTSALKLTDLSSRDEIIIDSGGIIGREGDFALDYFSRCDYVSRLHCEITPVDNGFMIEHLPTAKHPTKIDNIALSVRVPRALKDRSILTIADRNFRISINTTSAPEDTLQADATKQYDPSPDFISHDTEQINQADISESEEKHEIVCRKCGTSHDVPSEDSTLNECSGCEDKYDKRDIARVKARRKNAS